MRLTSRLTGVLRYSLAMFCMVAFAGLVEAGWTRPEFDKATFLGGSGNQRGIRITRSNLNDVDVWISAIDEHLYGGQALVAYYQLPRSEQPFSGVPAWTFHWPNVKGSGKDHEGLVGDLMSTHGTLFFVGRSWSQTQDGVGDKEFKSVVVAFPYGGPTGPEVGGAIWVAKPNFFTYRGNESLFDVTWAWESHRLYTTGYAQANWANNTAILAKYDHNGNLFWTRILGNTGWLMNSFGNAIVEMNRHIYVVGSTHYPYVNPDALRVTLWKYDEEGNQIWVRSHVGFIPGFTETQSVVAMQGSIYVVASVKHGPNGGVDALLLKYDEAGNLLWETTWGGPADDLGYGIIANNHYRNDPSDQRLYVVGETASFGSGGKDVFLLEVNPANGEVLSKYFHGGAADDIARGVMVVGSQLYVVGESKSFAEGGNLAGQNDIMLLRYRLAWTNPTLTVPIDIRPGSTENPLNPNSPGKIPVAILSSSRLKTPEVVKQDSLTFGRVGTERSLAFCSSEDVNGDGLSDLVCHFETRQTAFQDGDSEGILKGLTVSGQSLRGTDTIRIVPGATK